MIVTTEKLAHTSWANNKRMNEMREGLITHGYRKQQRERGEGEVDKQIHDGISSPSMENVMIQRDIIRMK